MKFFSYSGSKEKYMNLLNPFIDKTNKKVYVEPFVGSGAILFNLTKKFDKYVINDIDRNIIRIFNTFKEINFNDYNNLLNKIINEFGCIKTNKESYYLFRNWFNQNFWKSESIEEGVYLHILANSCINSFLRFGPNGMNQGWGNRLYILSNENFLKIKSVLIKTEILNEDYKQIINNYKDAFYFFDPPYFSQESSYKGFSENEFVEFLNKIKNLEFVYTDILNEFNKDIQNKMIIRNMRKTAPSTNKNLTGNLEYLFSSFEIIQNRKLF